MKFLYKRTIGIAIALIIFFFIGRVIYNEWDKISGYNWSPQLTWFFFSIITLIIVYLMNAYGWILIIRMINVKLGFTKGVSIFFISMFGRYIPGGIWSALSRIYLCRLEGISDSRSGMSIIMEQAYPVVSACIVFAASLLFWSDTGAIIRFLPALVLLPMFIIFLHPRSFLWVVNPILSRLGRGTIKISLDWNSMLMLTGYYFLCWIISGTAFYFFICSFYPLDLYYIPILSGIYAISFVAGYVTFLTPAGLGVREGALTVLLSFFIPTPIAIGVALLSRLWLIGVELTILLIFLLNVETRKMMKTALGW